MTKKPIGGCGESGAGNDAEPLGAWEDERNVERAAARLRLVTDRRLGKAPSPEWVVKLAAEKPGSCPDPGEKVRRAAHAASEKLISHQLEVARAKLKITLDRRLGRSTDEASLKLAQEEDY